MKPADAAHIVELAATIWPRSVKNTTATRESWTLALRHTNLYDAQDAVGSLAGERSTIHVSAIVKRAAAIRAALIRDLPPTPNAPVELADDPEAYNLWGRTARERQLHAARAARRSVPA